MARIPEILTGAILSAVACAPVNEAPKPINQPVAAATVTVTCDPETYAASLGLPTPVPVGGGEASAEIVTISRIMSVCGPLSDAEREAFIKFNIAHPLLATPDPAKDPARQIAPTSAPAPAPELAKKPENILPEYSVYYGQMKQEGGTGTGTAIIANIPGYPNQLYAFFIVDRSGQGYLYDITKADGNNLEAKGHGGIKITLKDARTLSGRLEKLFADIPTPWSFDIQYYGTGKPAALEAAKKLWAKEVANDPAAWPKVPDATILLAGFRKIDLP